MKLLLCALMAAFAAFMLAGPVQAMPGVTLVSPADGNQSSTATYVNYTFNCSAYDAVQLANISLWINSTGTWHQNQTESVTGLWNFSIFNLSLGPGFYIWSCRAANDSGGYNFSSENRTILVAASDLTPPNLWFSSPTLGNNTNTSNNYIEVNVSSNEDMSACVLDWNGVNESVSPSGKYCYINKTGFSQGYYYFHVYANDTAGNMNVTEDRRIRVLMPLAINYSIDPSSVIINSNVSIRINVSSEIPIDRIILNITMPNSTQQAFQFTGNATMNYTATLGGLYNLTIFANTTEGKNSTVSGSFSAYGNVTFNCTASAYNGSGIAARLEVYNAGTSELVSTFISDSGSFLDKEVPEREYDMLFKSYDSDFWVTLKSVNISQNLNRTVGFDSPPYLGYPIAYAVQNTFTFSSATVRIYYSGMNDEHIGLYICGNWSFAARSCDGSWSGGMSYFQDKNQHYISFDVTSFSAFFLKQETYCGDNICQPDESSSICPADCDCDSGDTMDCGSDVGECVAGEMTCRDGRWSDCQGSVGPKTETCNGRDDNCNGVIDDVNGGNSVQSSQCQCYGGQDPLPDELCNGIDDDCDGSIENNADCCTNGETRPCGTSISMGACHPGTSTCSGGTWSQCSGAVFPAAETCNDGVDNDCDGLTDYSDTQDCRVFNQSQNINQSSQPTCNNGIMDGSEEDVDCGGDCPPCFDYTAIWMTISIIGAAILAILVFMYFYLRRHGKELTWDELMRKWTPQEDNPG
jgi:hypothetical protein